MLSFGVAIHEPEPADPAAPVSADWYVDGGPREPEWSLRLLLTGGGLSRSECIGFRCAVDLPVPTDRTTPLVGQAVADVKRTEGATDGQA